ncbi:MAG: elongation factor P maturation arginine rhamnosyltransferase EarP [Fusobacteriaceae bacterium]
MKRKIDIFCQIIDNYGDIGVVYRLSKSLYKKYLENGIEIKIRVFLDRTEELVKLNSEAQNIQCQILNGIEYITYDYLLKNNLEPYEVIIEAFGCEINELYLEKAKEKSSLLINLEYLSSEDWALEFHGLESLLGAKKLKKYFFIPGFSEKTGGVLFSHFEKSKLESIFPYLTPEFLENKMLGTIFSYEKNFENLLETLNKQKKETILLVMGELSQKSVKEILEKKNVEKLGNFLKYGKIYIEFSSFISQEKYDTLVTLTDFNLVRGEDSFVRAVLSKKPFIWHAYFQEEEIHLEKIKGFFNRYIDYFKNYHNKNYLTEIDILKNLFLEYNRRDKKNLEQSKENYEYFFDNYEVLKEMSILFSDYIQKKCDLKEKLFQFIENKLK